VLHLFKRLRDRPGLDPNSLPFGPCPKVWRDATELASHPVTPRVAPQLRRLGTYVNGENTPPLD
jgi:hypothetical protein